ncbi:MAG: hypothetical protein JXB04_01725 [Kiritimatiellae bacterium]|nr:hypothetical protein [Kiritimatiellia bacterium]
MSPRKKPAGESPAKKLVSSTPPAVPAPEPPPAPPAGVEPAGGGASQSALMKAWMAAEAQGGAAPVQGSPVPPAPTVPPAPPASPAPLSAPTGGPPVPSIFGEPDTDVSPPADVEVALPAEEKVSDKRKVLQLLMLVVLLVGIGVVAAVQLLKKPAPPPPPPPPKARPAEAKKPDAKTAAKPKPEIEKAEPAPASPEKDRQPAKPASGQAKTAKDKPPAKDSAEKPPPPMPPVEIKIEPSRYLLPSAYDLPGDWKAARNQVDIGGIMKTGNEVVAVIEGEIVRKGGRVAIPYKGLEYRFVVTKITPTGVGLEPATD